MEYQFFKFQGTGNDFIIFDNRQKKFTRDMAKIYRTICDRHFGIGADGVMLFQEKEGFDFEMVYFNADGNESTMCGNGGRCMVRFAEMLGYAQKEFKFLAADGAHNSIIEGPNIRLQMQNVHEVEQSLDYYTLNTGSPQYVTFTDNVDTLQVHTEGAKVRNSDKYKANGINVNFVEIVGNGIKIRTYERGVEDETYSCGTGVTATALMFSNKIKLPTGKHSIQVQTLGGTLSVSFNKISESKFLDIWLTGPAQFVFSGKIELPV